MPTLFRDYETRSTLDLRDVGAWRYSCHFTTNVWCCGYAVDDGPAKLWVPGDPVPEENIEAARNPDWLVSAFNDGFERLIEQHIMAPRYGWPTVPIERHRCLQAAALAHALPADLKSVARVLKLANQKDEAGHKVMLQMAKPRRPRQGEDPAGVYWHDDPERLALLCTYCRQDVAVERELYNCVPLLSPEEQPLWELDARINDRGIHIDGGLLDAAIGIGEAAQTEINAELQSLTGGEITTIGQTDKLAKWLAAQGCAVVDLQKGTLKKALTRKSISPEARRVIELRLDGAHAAANKLERMRAWRNGDGRARGCFRFHGASTGRWTSFGIQLQNLKRPETEDLGGAIATVATGDLNQVRAISSQPMSVVGDITRALISAAPGHRLIAADFSGVESRITAWVSGQQSKLDQWATFDRTQNPEEEPYFILGRSLGFEGKQARDLGKIADLAFGYMGAVGAWKKLAPADDASTEEQIKRRQQAWRNEHPETVRFWRGIDSAAIRAVRTPGQVFACGRVAFKYEGDFLRMRLPSGRKITYPFPRLETNGYGNAAIVFMDHEQGRWVECRHGHGSWPGLWIENAVQAIARDVFAAAMQRVEAAGYPIVLHIHDEVVCEVPDGFGTTEEFLELITRPPSWADGLPIAAKVRNGPRFCKSEPLGSSLVRFGAPGDTEIPPAFVSNPDANMPSEPTDTAPVVSTAMTNGSASSQTNHDDADRSNRNGYASGERPWGRNVDTYIYRDERGEPYLKVTRTSAKQFPQAHWNGGHWVNGKPKGPKIPYRLPELLAAPPKEPVWIAEGEKDADNVATLGVIATTNSEGAGKWTDDLNRWFTGKQIGYVLEDNDASGRAHAAKVAAALHGILREIRVVSFRELPEHGDVSDWIERGGTREQLIQRARTAPKFDGAATLKSARASTYKLAAVQWIWPGRLALGKLGIIAGLPDEGKGQILCDVAARITRGSLWPCNEGRAFQGNVILLTAEDDIEDTIVPRLRAADADLECVEIVRMVREQGKERMFSLITDLNLLRRKVLEVGNVRMIQIDPISAYLGFGKIDSFRATDVRAALGPLVDLASKLRVSVLGIMHFNKKIDVTNALLRISDSLAFGATSRHVYAVVNDAEHGRKLFVKGKNNLAPQNQMALAYNFDACEVGKDEQTGVPIWAPHFVWHPEHVDVTATEAMQAAAESKPPAARDTAKRFLEDLLGNGPVAQADIEEAAKANGIAKRTFYRAKAELKIKAVKDGPMKDGQRTWRWHRPSTETGEA